MFFFLFHHVYESNKTQAEKKCGIENKKNFERIRITPAPKSRVMHNRVPEFQNGLDDCLAQIIMRKIKFAHDSEVVYDRCSIS